MADGQQMNELPFMSWPLSGNDLFIMEKVSDPLPLRKIRLSSLQSLFQGGWPSPEELPEGALTPPTWNLKGVEGGWRIRIGADVIAGTDWYFIYKLNHATGLYGNAVWAVAESRDPGEKGPLEYIHLAEETDPPDRYYGTFKVQSVSADFQGPLSDALSAWTLYDLPSDWLPNAPTLLTAGGYPLISRSLLPDGGLGYTISLKIQAPADQKNFLKEYVIDRVCDEGDTFEGKPTKTNTLVLKATPRAKIVIWHDTDRSFVPGYQYRYTVYAKALNNNLGPVSNTQDKTLTDDTTAPDDPVFTVKTSPGNIEVNFDPIKVGGVDDVGWAYIQLQYRIDAGSWVDVILDKTLSFVFSVAEADYADEYEFQAKVFDYAGNANVGGWQTDENTYTAGKITELCFGTPLYNKVEKIEVNEGHITNHSSEITQNATNINLRVSKNDVINQINISTEEILIDGNTLHITADTTFDADVVIRGLLNAAGGIKTAAGTTYMRMGKYGGSAHQLRYVYGGTTVGDFYMESGGDCFLYVRGKTGFGYSSLSATGVVVVGTAGGAKVSLINDGTIEIEGNQVVGARLGAIGFAGSASGTIAITLDDGSDSVDRAGFNTKLATLKTHLDELVTAVNVIKATVNTVVLRLGISYGHGLTAD